MFFYFYVQVDVVDTEFSALLAEISHAVNFQLVLRAHRNFIAAIVKMSFVDNSVIQDAIERVLQICLRFLSVSSLLRLQDSAENDKKGKAAASIPQVPPEELVAIKKDFFSQLSYLFQLMRKIENRGFIFRLDFNGFLSELS
jgi:gamma-tubulin complex component 4